MGNRGQSTLSGTAFTLLACLQLAGCERNETVSPAGQFASEISLASAGDQAVAAWYGGAARNAIWARSLDDSAGPAGVPFQLTDGARDAYEPDIQFLGQDWIVAWYEKDRASGALTAWLGRFSTQGGVRWRQALSAPGLDGRNPVVRIRDDAMQAAWIETSTSGDAAIWTARIDAAGKFLQPPLLRAPADPETWNLNAAIDPHGTFHVVYDSGLGTRAKEVRLLRIGPQDATATLLGVDDGHDSTYPDLAFSGDDVALTWFDARDGNAEIYLFAGKADDLHSEVGRRAARITETPGASIGAYLAWNGQRLRLAWCDDSSGQFEIYSQLFDAQGRPRDKAVRLTDNPTQSLSPAIRAWREGFVLAWNEYRSPGADEGEPGARVSTAVSHVMR